MKVKAKNGKLERVPAGLPKDLIDPLKNGKIVEVDSIPHKLTSLVDIVEDKKKAKKEDK
jgi:hypothetical protein